MLGKITAVATLVAAVLAGLEYFSFWWVMIPAFLAASLVLSNGPGFDIAATANREGRLGVFPRMLAVQFVVQLTFAGAVYGLTRLFT